MKGPHPKVVKSEDNVPTMQESLVTEYNYSYSHDLIQHTGCLALDSHNSLSC